MVEVGDKVKDMVSGIEGTTVSKTEFLNGCVQFGVQPKVKKGTNEINTWNIDEEQLKVISKKNVKVEKKSTGGPTMKRANRY